MVRYVVSGIWKAKLKIVIEFSTKNVKKFSLF